MTAITRYRGDTKPDRIYVKTAAGIAVDITGASFKLTVNPQIAPVDATAQIVQIVGVIVDGPNGIVDFPWDATESNVTPGTYYYDVQMTSAGGDIETLTVDKYIFKQDITKG